MDKPHAMLDIKQALEQLANRPNSHETNLTARLKVPGFRTGTTGQPGTFLFNDFLSCIPALVFPRLSGHVFPNQQPSHHACPGIPHPCKNPRPQ